ncbi:MAG: hypothetical protein ACRCW4_00510, partial [Candidatus Neomicrothrix subdominans]
MTLAIWLATAILGACVALWLWLDHRDTRRLVRALSGRLRRAEGLLAGLTSEAMPIVSGPQPSRGTDWEL